MVAGRMWWPGMILRERGGEREGGGICSCLLTVSSQISPVAWSGQVRRGFLHQLRQRQRAWGSWHQTLGIQPGIHLWEVLQGGSRVPKAGLKGDSRDSRRQGASGKYTRQ